MNKKSKIYVAGHRGLVGSAIVRRLNQGGYLNVVHSYCDLRKQDEVDQFFHDEKPDYVFLAAAKVGGILANSTYTADFIYDNLMIASNVIKASVDYGVQKLLNLGSACIYPRISSQPLKEEYLMRGPLEPTNEAYAVAKIAGIKLCRYFNEQYHTNFLSLMPTNQYGINDHFDLENCHVLPAMLRRFHEAKENNLPSVKLWGTGNVTREFMHADDLADACVYIMEKYDYADIGEFINVGTGQDIPLRELAEIIKGIVGFEGNIDWDSSKPDGMPQRRLDVSKLTKLGWTPKVALAKGISSVYDWYKLNFKEKE